LRERKVSFVNGIEGATEEADIHIDQLNFVILSGVDARKAAPTQSKDPNCSNLAQAPQGIPATQVVGRKSLPHESYFKLKRGPSTPQLLRFAKQPLRSG
jgi:hypothetical protein